MTQETEAMIQQEFRSGEKLLWSGKPQSGIVFHRFSIILVILILFAVALVGGLIILNNMTHSIRILEILTAGSRFKFTVIGLLASLFIGLGLISLWGFIFYPLQRRKTIYALTNQRVLIVSGLLKRKIKSFVLSSLNFTSLTEPVKDKATIIFGEVDPIQYGITDLTQKQRKVNTWKWFGYKFENFEAGWPTDSSRSVPTRPVLGRLEHIEDARTVYKMVRETARIDLRKAPDINQPGFLTSLPEYARRPGTITFVIDVSSSMGGVKLEQAKKGLMGALNMAQSNQVGLISFADRIQDTVPVAPLMQNRRNLTACVGRMSASGSTALYDAIKEGIEMTDCAAGTKEDIRAVVVLTDGQANQGLTRLDDIIKMKSREGRSISKYYGFENDIFVVDSEGREVSRQNILGSQLAMKTNDPIQIFFIGIGSDADMEIGRMLAEATGAESQRGFKVQKVQRVREVDIARVLEEFKYF